MIIPEYYEFFSQVKFIFGTRSLENIPVELEGYNAHRPIVICNKDNADAGIGKALVKALYDSRCVIGALFDECPSTATASLVNEITVLFRERECDSIVAVGGNPVVDIAKGLRIAVSEKKDITKLAGLNTVSSPSIPLFIVPTLGLNGYETSNRAVIDDKFYISDALYPDAVVIDSRTVGSIDKAALLDSAFIALTHAIEACAESLSNPMTDSYGLTCIQYISENLGKVIKDPGYKKGCMALINAFAAAGIAYSNAPAGITHYLGESLARVRPMSPGLLMGMLLPVSLEYKQYMNSNIRDELLLALSGFDEYSHTEQKKRVPRALEIIQSMVKNFPDVVSSDLKSFGFNEDDLVKAAGESVSKSGKVLKLKDCMNILKKAWDGSSFKK